VWFDTKKASLVLVFYHHQYVQLGQMFLFINIIMLNIINNIHKQWQYGLNREFDFLNATQGITRYIMSKQFKFLWIF